ncbi:MAG: hypothetical protein KDA53_18160 [Hyphomonas sp.]|nr:hypothetical protein [Hyphomonas sp.]
MHDLRSDLTKLWRAASRLAPASGGRTVMFVAAEAGEGTSSVAASFALMAAEQATRTAWLVDLDFMRNPDFEAFRDGFARKVGKPGRAYDAALKTEQIYSVAPPAPGASGGQKFLTAHAVEGTKLLVTRFREERLLPGQRVGLRPSPDWWGALRKAADWIIVDAPALSESSAALTFANQMDGVVLVVRADRTSVEDVASVTQEIENHGGRVVGAVMNRIRADARLADRLGV